MSYVETLRLLIAHGRSDSVQRELQRYLSTHPADIEGWMLMGEAVDDPKQKAECYSRVLQIDPENLQARSKLEKLGFPLQQGKEDLTEPREEFENTLEETQPIKAPNRMSFESYIASQASTPAPQQNVDERIGGDTSASKELEKAGKPASSTFTRVARYISIKSLTLSVMLAIAIYLSVVFVNYGGFIDVIAEDGIMGSIRTVNLERMKNGFDPMTAEETQQYIADSREAAGLNKPFLLRCVGWFVKAATFDWGVQSYYSPWYSMPTATTLEIIADRLPRTLLLAGTANLFLFISCLFLALFLSRNHQNILNKIVIGLSPLSTVPNWMYGILLTVIFSSYLKLLPFGGMYDDYPPATPAGYIPIVLKHMILPVTAIGLNMFFQTAYIWRNYFLIHSEEDYVDLARAKGLTPRELERKYILRPTLPFVITNFVLMVLTFWQGVIVLEWFFNWPGVGEIFLHSIQTSDRPLILTFIVLFAYLLALSILILDILLAFVDPRIHIGSDTENVRLKAAREKEESGKGFQLFNRESPRVERPAGVVMDEHPTRSMHRSLKVSGEMLGHQLKILWDYAKPTVTNVLKSPRAIIGLIVIAFLVIVSIFTLIYIPPERATLLWRTMTEEVADNPVNAKPAWINFFRKDKLPETIVVDSRQDRVTRLVTSSSGEVRQSTLFFQIDYFYDGFPQEIYIFFKPEYQAKMPFVHMVWETPSGREIDMGRMSIKRSQIYMTPTNLPLGVQFTGNRIQGMSGGEGGEAVVAVLFVDPDSGAQTAEKGTYWLKMEATTFEESSTVDARVVVYGKVFGLAGTDNLRRDLSVALLWGTPVALVFGILGALITTFLSIVIAAASAWFRGWVDELIQRITEVNMILPAFPIALMVYYLVSHSIWVALSVVVVLTIFSTAVKTYRAAFIQAMESPYIEAARAYGAGDWRIIWQYLMPRIFPVLIPQLTNMVPFFVFYEATLAMVGVMDQNLPTWGKVLFDAFNYPYGRQDYWLLEPVTLMMITGLAFAMVGSALNSVLNPRLTES